MKRAMPSVVCVAWIVSFASMGTPVALADDASFFVAGRAIGLPWSSDTMIKAGRSICYFFTRGRNADEVVFHTQRYALIKPPEARAFVRLSVNEYCPQFSPQLGP